MIAALGSLISGKGRMNGCKIGRKKRIKEREERKKI
jgi:hypothetical protein